MLLCADCESLKYDRTIEHFCEVCQKSMKFNVHLCTLCSLKLNKCQLCLKKVTDEKPNEMKGIQSQVLIDFIEGKQSSPIKEEKIIKIEEIMQ